MEAPAEVDAEEEADASELLRALCPLHETLVPTTEFAEWGPSTGLTLVSTASCDLCINLSLASAELRTFNKK